MCGGCRFIWELLYDDLSKLAVEVAERFVEGLATIEELNRANWEGGMPPTFQHDSAWSPGNMGVLQGCCAAERPELGEVWASSRKNTFWKMSRTSIRWCKQRLTQPQALRKQHGVQVHSGFFQEGLENTFPLVDWPGDWLLRCVFGKPFLPPVIVDPEWLTSNVIDLAGVIYQERALTGCRSLAMPSKKPGAATRIS